MADLKEATQELDLIVALQPQLATASQVPTQTSPHVNRHKEGHGAGRPPDKMAPRVEEGRLRGPKAQGQRQQSITAFFHVGRLERGQGAKSVQPERRTNKPAPNSGQHARNAAAAARKPDGDNPPRHDFHAVCSHGFDPEPCQRHVPNGSNMEADETGRARQTETPYADRRRSSTLGSLEQSAGKHDQGSRDGLDDVQLGQPDSCQMGPGGQEACAGPQPNLPEVPLVQAKEMLVHITKLCVTPLVINRFHATGPLAETYSNPTLTMMLQIGLRTEEANMVWRNLNILSQCSVWVAAGTYLRHERMQRSALANRLASMSG